MVANCVGMQEAVKIIFVTYYRLAGSPVPTILRYTSSVIIPRYVILWIVRSNTKLIANYKGWTCAWESLIGIKG